MSDPRHQPATSGELRFDTTGEVVGPMTVFEDLVRLRAARGARTRLGGGLTEVTVGIQPIMGAEFQAIVRFRSDRLYEIELIMVETETGQRWPEWTLENELARKSAHERWAARAFQAPMELLPFPGPERIVPAEPLPEHPRGASFGWGTVTSYYEGKAGFAWMVVRYV